MSSILFHGPGARQEALNEAARRGRLVAPPVGDDKLGIEQVREVTDLLLSTPVGMKVGVVVIGPMDRTASAKASDGLLKTIEEHSSMVLPVLWAYDLGGVSPTIKSRCLQRWCPQVDFDEDDEIQGDGRQIVASALAGRLWQIPALVKKYDVKDNKRLPDLLGVMAQALASDFNEDGASLWERLRAAASHRNPTSIEVIAALLPEVAE